MQVMGNQRARNMALSIFSAYYEFQKADGPRVRLWAERKRELEGTIQKRRQDLAEIANKVRDLQLEIDQKSAIWRQEEKERKAFELRSQRRELAREQDNLRRLLRESQRDLEERQRMAIAKVLKEVRVIVTEIGKQDGLDVIVDSASGGVLFTSSKVDLTERVIKRYDQKKK